MKKWHIEKTSYSISDFIAWQKDNNLVLNPDFQRRPVWLPGAKSPSVLLQSRWRGPHNPDRSILTPFPAFYRQS